MSLGGFSPKGALIVPSGQAFARRFALADGGGTPQLLTGRAFVLSFRRPSDTTPLVTIDGAVADDGLYVAIMGTPEQASEINSLGTSALAYDLVEVVDGATVVRWTGSVRVQPVSSLDIGGEIAPLSIPYSMAMVGSSALVVSEVGARGLSAAEQFTIGGIDPDEPQAAAMFAALGDGIRVEVQDIADDAATSATQASQIRDATQGIADLVTADAVTVAGDRILAEQAATNADNSAALALSSVVRYPDTATGLAATAEGGYFLVVGTGDVFASQYRKISGAAVFVNSYASKSALDAALALSTSVQNGTVPALGSAARQPMTVYESDGPHVFTLPAGTRSAFVIAVTDANGSKREILRFNDATKVVSFDPGYSMAGNFPLPSSGSLVDLTVTGTLDVQGPLALVEASAADFHATNSASYLDSATIVYEDRSGTAHFTTLGLGLENAWTLGGARKLLRFDTLNNVLRPRVPAQDPALPADALVHVNGFPWINGNTFPTTFPTAPDTAMAQTSDGVVTLPALTSYDTAYGPAGTFRHNEAASIARMGSRLWATWYSLKAPAGDFAERYGNYLVLAYSDDDGATWHECLYVVPRDPLTQRVFDTQVVATPEGRLAVLYTQSGNTNLWDRIGGAWCLFINNPEASAAIFDASTHYFLGNGVPGRPRMFGNELHMAMDYWRIGTSAPLKPERAGKQYCRFVTNEMVPRVERIDTIPLAGAAFTGSWSASGAILTVTAIEVGTIAVGDKVDNTNPAATVASFGTGAGGVGTYNLSVAQAAASGSGRKVTLIDYDETQIVHLRGGNVLAMWRTIAGPYYSVRVDGAWSAPAHFTAFAMPSSRHSVARSPSGRMWMMFNYHAVNRTNMSASWLMNEDPAQVNNPASWSTPYTFDTGSQIAYPVLDFDGINIYGCADQGRGQALSGVPNNIFIYKISEAAAVAGAGTVTITTAAS